MTETRSRPAFAPAWWQWLCVLACGIASASMQACLFGYEAAKFAADVCVIVALATLLGWVVWWIWALVGRWRQRAARIAFMFGAVFFTLRHLQAFLHAM